MALSLADVLPDYKAALHDAASVFKGTQADPDADFKRHLQTAARALGRDGKRSATQLGTLTLLAGQATYTDVPADLVAPKVSDWGVGEQPAWMIPPGALPVMRLATQDGAPVLVLRPAPSAAQIAAFGAAYRYYYLAAPVLDADASTVADADRDLLVLRAMVEAARELVNRNLHKPVAMQPGSGSYPSNQTPAGWYQMLLDEYRKAA